MPKDFKDSKKHSGSQSHSRKNHRQTGKPKSNTQDKGSSRENNTINSSMGLGTMNSSYPGEINLTRPISVDVPSVREMRMCVQQFMRSASAYFSSAQQQMLTPKLEQVISAFSTERGYISSTTAQNIYKAFELSYDILSIIVTKWRFENLAALKDTTTGMSIAGLFNGTMADANYNRQLDLVQLIDASQTGSPQLKADSGKVSNVEWTREWVGNLSLVSLPKSAILDVFDKFMAYFKMPKSQIETYFHFIPYAWIDPTISDYKTSNLKHVLDVKIQEIKDLRTAHPDLVQILNLIGWNDNTHLNHDFTRDITATTLLVREEDFITDVIANSTLSKDELTYVEIMKSYNNPIVRTIYSSKISGSSLAYDDKVTEDITYLRQLFSYVGNAALGIGDSLPYIPLTYYLLENAGTLSIVSDWAIATRHYHQLGDTSLSNIEMTYLNVLKELTKDTLNQQIIYLLNLRVDQDGLNRKVTILDARMNEVQHVGILPDSFDNIYNVARTSDLFNGIPYRSALDTLIQALAGNAIARNSITREK